MCVEVANFRFAEHLVTEASQKKSYPLPGSDELLRLMFESAKDFAIFTTDSNGFVTSWNPGAERLLGYKEAEIVGHSASVLFPPEADPANAEAGERRDALANGRAEDERWQQRKDGSRLWASGLLMPLSDPAVGFVKVLRDRTDGHQSEERLRESEEQFRLLATNIPQLVFRCEPNGARAWGSPQWTIFTGMTLPESLEFGWIYAVHPDDREETVSAWQQAQKTGKYYVEHRMRRASDGEYRWFQTRAVPVQPSGRELAGWVGTSTDIHDIRMLQDEQKVLLTELQHRSRNVLAVVQALARQSMRSSRSLQEFAPTFESRLRALSRVQGLLARSDREPVPLRELIEAELKAHGDGAAHPGKVSIEGPPVMLPATSVQALALALHELATNAVKYGALHGPAGKLSVRWDLESRGAQQRAHLHWSETGIAIPEVPKRRGYGTEMIERALPYQLGTKTKLEFKQTGVFCEITVPIANAESTDV
jgi:PAS domain S-box-containing protein